MKLYCLIKFYRLKITEVLPVKDTILLIYNKSLNVVGLPLNLDYYGVQCKGKD